MLQTRSSNLPWVLSALMLLLLPLLAGCGGSSGSGGTVAASGLKGKVTGGGAQNPIGGARVTLYAMGSSGYGVGATTLSSATSDNGGAFTFGSYTCPAGNPQTYVIATGGNPGSGTNNAIGLMALTGPCNSLSASTFVMVNELTTVAAQYALAQFSDATGQDFGSSSTNATGLNNAVSLAAGSSGDGTDGDLVTSYLLTGGTPSNTGVAAPFWAASGASEANCTGSTPAVNCDGLEQMDTIANILAQCINNTEPSSPLPSCASAAGACNILFACTGTPVAGTTLEAVHQMASNPAANVSSIFNVQGTPASAPFTPAKSAAPNAWTLALNYTGGGLSAPSGIAIDAAGNAWVANIPSIQSLGNSLSEFSSGGSAISGSSGYTGGGLSEPDAIAIDASGHVWAANYGANSLSEFSSGGSAISGPSGYTGGGLNGPQGIAIDAAGNAWVANHNHGSISEFSSGGSALSGSGYTGGGLNGPVGIAIDAAGNAWVANSGGNSLSEFSSGGSALSGSGYTGGGLNGPAGIAIDALGNAWVANSGGELGISISEFSSTGAAISRNSGYTGGGLRGPQGIAIDAAGNAWVANYNHGSISEFSSAGSALSGSGYTGGGLNGPQGIAIDAAGNAWVANLGGNSLSEFIGAARPVLTPLVACLTQATPSAVCLP